MSKISELSDGGVIQGGDTLIAVRSGGNVKVTYGGTTTANIDGGNIDGTVIGGTTTAAGSFTTLQADTSLNVDGTVTADGLTVDGAGAKYISIGSTDGTAAQIRLDGSANGDFVGGDYSVIKNENNDLTFISGVPNGDMEFFTHDGSGNKLRQKIGSGGDITFYDTDGSTASFVYDASAGLTINEAGADRDFRVESDSYTHMFFVDAGNDAVVIGANAQANNGKLTVAGTAVFTEATVGSFISDNAWIDYVSASRQLRINAGAISGQSSAMEIGTVISGTQRSAIEVDTSGNLTINEDSVDKDFRVESNNNTHMLFVDASADNLGIGISQPVELIHAATSSLSLARFDSTGTSGAYVKLRDANTGSGQFAWYGADGDSAAIYSNNSHLLLKGTGSEAVFNEQGNDYNFRVEGDTSQNLFVVDAGTNRVEITKDSGTGTALEVQNNFNNVLRVTQNDTSLSNNTFAFEIDNSAQVSNLSSAGAMRIETYYGDSFKVDGMGRTILNDVGDANGDFRVESDSNSHMIFVDAASGAVGINNSDPQYGLDLKASLGIRNGGLLLGRDSGSNTGGIFFFNPNASPSQVRIYRDTGLWGGTSGAENVELQLYDGSAYSLRLNGASGVSFNGGSNYLDDYEEGTWTPVFAFNGSDTGITFSSRYGKYTKIGNRVFFDAFIVLSSKGTATGSAQVSLPFSASDDATFTGHEASFSLGFAEGVGNITRVGMFNGKIIFYDDGSTNNTGEADNEFTNSANFRVTGSYQTT